MKTIVRNTQMGKGEEEGIRLNVDIHERIVRDRQTHKHTDKQFSKDTYNHAPIYVCILLRDAIFNLRFYYTEISIVHIERECRYL